MRLAIPALMLGLAVSAGVAQAADSVSTTNVDIATLSAMEPIDMHVLSDTGSTVSLSMSALIPGAEYETMGGYYSPEINSWFNTASLQFNVRDGYRITALTIGAKVTGVLEVTPPPTDVTDLERPYATNAFYASWTVNGSPTRYGVGATDVDGSQAYSGTVPQWIAGQSVLEFSGYAGAEAMSYERLVCTDHCWYQQYPAFASIRVSDVVMTVQIAAVPEPTTWMLLLGGLGVLGAAARRRNA